MELVTGIATKVGSQTIDMRQKTEFDTSGEFPVDKGSLYPLIASAEGVINLAYTPKEAATAIRVYLADDDCGTPLDMAAATLDGTALTVADAAGKKVIVYYTYDTSDAAETYVVDAEHFSGTYRLVGDTVVRNAQTGKDEPFQVRIPNLKWTSNLELGFSAEGDPSTITFECEIMRDVNTGTMIEMVKYA